MSYKPTVVFDLDGVIHSYTSGWKGAGEIPDPPVAGIDQVIARLRNDGYKVVVVSARCATAEGMGAVRKYLRDYQIVVDDVMAEKPPAICYVDDRAICFNGNTDGLYEKIKSFKSWTQTGFIRNDTPVKNLRPCTAERWINGCVEPISGWFHGWVNDFEQFENGAVNISMAMVEDVNGKVHPCFYNSVRFLDRGGVL